jgi:lysozyme
VSGLRIPDPYAGPLTRGVDVSSYQGHVLWPRVRAAGVEFAIARIGDGLHTDKTFAANYAGARAAGLVVGAYQFMRPSVDPVEQAKVAVGALSLVYQHGDLPIALDVERGDGSDDAAAIADAMLAWIAVLENALGVTPTIYAGAFFAAAVHDARLGAFPLWTPDYAAGDCRVPRTWAPPGRGWTFRQTSGTGHVDGIAGAVDLDVFRGDRSALDAFRGVTVAAPPAT